MRLLNPQDLERSSVVANCSMNRERRLGGSNSYGRDLHLDILALLRDQLRRCAVRWADLCCGTGRALVESAAELRRPADADRVQIEGIDLAGLFDPNPFPDTLTLVAQSVESWLPASGYTLVTCVHGLHYVGDKLAAIAKAARSLAPGGLLIANLDLANFRYEGGRPAGRAVATLLRRNGLSYDARRRLVRCEGPCEAEFKLRYLGADDAAGPNYTGQPAVDSYYAG
jgi:SAM-dependent methyltransferase